MASGLRVRVASRTLVKASNPPAAPPVLYPSNLDHLPSNIPASFITVYPKPSTGDFSSVVATVKASLPAFLNYFYPFAGRIVADPKTGVPEVHCNNAGAELVVGHVDIPLSRVDFSDATKSLDKIQLPYGEDIPLSLQVTCFACGGFSIVWGTSHLLADGYGLAMLPTFFTELVQTKKLTRVPNHDRSIFQPRNPPVYSPETGRSLAQLTLDDLINSLSAGIFVKRLYQIDAKDVEQLRKLASRTGRKASRMEAVSVYIWKVFARVVRESGDTTCRMAWLVDGRQRLAAKYSPQVMRDYVGNVITFAAKEVDVDQAFLASYPRMAEEVSGAIREVTKDVENHFQEMIDWVEGRKVGKRANRVQVGLGSPAVVVSSFAHAALDVDFGFGQAALVVSQLPWGRLGSSFMIVLASPKGDGSLVVNAYTWAQVAAALESDPDRIFKPVTAESLGLVARPSRSLVASRL